jgi:signal transduction histidine kinase
MADPYPERIAPFDDSILIGMSHAFGSETDLDDLLRASRRWISLALGGAAIGLRYVLPDADGRLRVMHEVGDDIWHDPGLQRARLSIDGNPARRIEARAFGGARIVTFPLVSRGVTYGAVEIATAPTTSSTRWEQVGAIVSQTAVALANHARHSALDRGRESMRRAAELGASMVGAGTREAGLRTLVRGLHRDLGVASAAWLIEPGRTPKLISAGGLGPRGRDRLRNAGLADPDPRQTIGGLVESFTSTLGRPRIETAEASGAVVAMEAPRDPAIADATASLRGLATEWLESWAMLEAARRRADRYERTLAVTAHEIRGPMLAAKAAIDAMLEEGGHAREHRLALRRSRQQLEDLAETVDELLRWSHPDVGVRRRRTDLTRLVDEAITSVVLETGEERVVFEPPLTKIVASVSRRHLSLAVADLVRNAIAYSPPGSLVDVRVTVQGRSALISVHDRGDKIAEDDVEAIFHPFERGRAGTAERTGSGLGLFVVKRVAEAHGGSVWVDLDRSGTTFHLSVPLRANARSAREARLSSTR